MLRFTSALLLATSFAVIQGQETTVPAADPLDIYRQYHTCNICPSEGETTTTNFGLPYETSKVQPLSCDEARALAADGRYSPAACILLRMRIHEDCGCAVGGGQTTTTPSIPSVGDLLSAAAIALNAKEEKHDDESNTTEAALETESPKEMDTTTVTSTSTVLLAPVPGGSLEDAQVVAFQGSMRNFLSDRIEETQDLHCEIADQHVSSSKLVSAVEIVVTCSGQSTSISSEEFQELTNKAIESEIPQFLQSLRENPDFGDYIATVFNFDDGLDVKESGDAEEKSYVWITAGAFAIGGLMILAVFVIIFAVKMRELKMLQVAAPVRKVKLPFGKSPTRLSKMPIPVTAAAAVAALVRESIDPEVKCLALKEEEITETGETAATMSSLRRDMNSRSVKAPAGKLGIVIDTTLDGPVVHSVKPTSPIFGLVFPGDMIVAVNNEDTRAMSAVALTDLMTRTSEVERELVVLSQDVVG